jgi:rod shape-determining protein MreD
MRKYSEMRYLYAIPIFLFIFILQTTFTRLVDGFNGPNLLLCLVVVFSFLYYRLFGLILGCSFGILLDIVSKPIVGIESLTLIIAFIIPVVMRLFFSEEKLIPCVFAGLLATTLNIFIKLGIYKFSGFSLGVFDAVIALRNELILNSIVIIIFHIIFVKSIIKFKKDKRFQGGYWY